MATVTAMPTSSGLRSRWTYLLAYVAAVVVAELLIALPGPAKPEERPFQPIGLGIHILLVFTLMFLSVVVQPKDATLANLLVATSLASLVRVFSLAVPRYPFFTSPSTEPINTIPWLALVSVPLLVSVGAVAYVQRLRPKDLGLQVVQWKDVPIQLAIAATGLPLGFVEYTILKPQAWIAGLALVPLVVGSVVIFLATGLSEELIFRAVLLRRAVEGLGQRGGLLFVTAIFASLHIFFLSAVDLAFVFAVGLFYGVAVLKTRNLWGAIFSHSLGNIVLYLIAPFLFPR